MSNKFCIGDVHGCLFTLEKLLEKLPKDAEIIFTGDLCDKGLHTKEVFELAIEAGHTVIKGNHETLMENHLLDVLEKGLETPWVVEDMYGGRETVESYMGDIEKAKRHLEFIENMPHYVMADQYFITHGFGLPYFQQKENAERQIKSNRLGREFPDWEEWEDYEIINVFGHCDFEEVEKGKNFFGIDTGAVYGNKLTAFELGTHKIIQQKTLEKDIYRNKK